MRIVELKLDAFGPFTKVDLDLSAGSFGLHILYGPNEAGKSSALRAIRQLLYGIHGQTSDDFIHNYRSLRLGGTLERSDGERLEFIRLKRIKNPLLQADGSTALEQSRLDRFLGGVDQALFSSLFGIDHETLVKGGQEIADAGGRLANVLFAASSGIANLRSIQKQLQEKADELFKPGGSKQRIPRTIAELREANLRLKELQLPGDRWARHERALGEARRFQAELQARWREKEYEANRLKRIQAALPLFSERAQLLSELDRYHDAVILPDEFAECRRHAQAALAAAALEIDRARRSLAELAARREAIALPIGLLAAEQDVEALRNARAEQRKAQEDRVKRERDLQEKEHAARDVLQTLGKPRDLAAADTLRLRVDEPARIAQLAHQFTELTTRRGEARAAALKHGDRLAALRRDLETLGPPADLSRLRAALEAALGEGNLEDQHGRVSTQLVPLERELEAASRQLPGWTGTLDDLEALSVPLPETLSRRDAEIQQAETAARDLDRTRVREEAAIQETEARLRGQSLQVEVPSEDDLRDARRRREAGWAQVRSAWLREPKSRAAAERFAVRTGSPGSMADAYEQTVSQADHLADRLRREAQTVAAKAEWLAQLQKHQAALARISEDLAGAGRRRDALRGDWQALLGSLGLPPMEPSEMRAWIGFRESILVQHRRVREFRAQRDRLETLIAGHRERLASALAAVLGPQAAGFQGLASPIEEARTLIARNDELARKRERLEVRIAEEQAALDGARLQLEATEAELASRRVPWAELMGRIGLGPDATAEQAHIVQAEISRLFQLIEEADGFRSRIRGIDRDAARFAADARELARRVAPELADRPPAEIADALWDRLRTARDDRQRHQSLCERIEAEERCLEQAGRARDAARLETERLCREAGCDSEADLPLAERRSARRSQIETDLRRCEGQIRQQSAGASVADFALEVAEADPDTLELTIEDLEAERKRIQQELQEVSQTVGSETAQLAQMDGSSKAAEANEAAGFALGQLLEDVPRFAVLRLASKVLQRGIERYRERHQGPVLDRASEIFGALTGGSFERLKVETNERNESVIMGVRPGGEVGLGVDAMSTGSCDQLYLAIRIAYLEHWLEGREPLPFIVDDILLQFDDDRAMAALKVLGELSRRTQVIFFTHHAHLLELARRCLASDVLFPQLLPCGAPMYSDAGKKL
jgi:uncharacterized protein YhaN